MLEEVELTGQEDPLMLYSVIATLPSYSAYREGTTVILPYTAFCVQMCRIMHVVQC